MRARREEKERRGGAAVLISKQEPNRRRVGKNFTGKTATRDHMAAFWRCTLLEARGQSRTTRTQTIVSNPWELGSCVQVRTPRVSGTDRAKAEVDYSKQPLGA